MPFPVLPPRHSRPRATARPAPRADLRPAPAAPAVNPKDDSGSSRQPLIYWPVIGALAGLCVVLLMLLALVLRSDRPRPADHAVAQASHQEANGSPDADADRGPAHRDAPPVASPPPQQPHADAPAPPAPPDADPPDDGSPAPPPPPTGLPVLLAPRSGECPAPAPGEAPGCGHYGTAVNFVDDPAEAARQALRGKKLLFVLHVAGNFEDSHFT